MAKISWILTYGTVIGNEAQGRLEICGRKGPQNGYDIKKSNSNPEGLRCSCRSSVFQAVLYDLYYTKS